MTTEQRANIGRGVRIAATRKRQSEAMKESWRRRRANGALSASVLEPEPGQTKQESLWEVAKVLGIDTDELVRAEIRRVLDI